MFPEHRYVELFLNSTERGSNGGYGGHMGGMGKLCVDGPQSFTINISLYIIRGGSVSMDDGCGYN